MENQYDGLNCPGACPGAGLKQISRPHGTQALMTLGPDRQYVIASPKDMPRDALHLHHARYWRREDSRDLADPNPFVIRKERAADSGEPRAWSRFKLPFGGKTL